MIKMADCKSCTVNWNSSCTLDNIKSDIDIMSMSDFMLLTDYCGKEIFIAAVVVVSVLILIIVSLLIAVGCLARKCCRIRNYSPTANEDDPEKKGSSYKMVEVGENREEKDDNAQTKRNDDAKLENFAEAMYATVDCTPEIHTKDSGKAEQKMVDVDLATDAGNYDIIITHEPDEGQGHSAANMASNKSSKERKKNEVVVEEKIGHPSEMPFISAEYAVPDKAQKKNKKISKAEPSQGGDNKLVHTTFDTQQQLSVQPPLSSVYSEISPEDFKHKSTSTLELDDKQRRKSGRMSSPPEEPPPLPPPFLEDKSLEQSGVNVRVQTDIAAALKLKKLSSSTNVNTKRENAGAFCSNERGDGHISSKGLDTSPLYEDPDGLTDSHPPQETYMNVNLAYNFHTPQT